MVEATKTGETPNVRGVDLGSVLRDSGFSEIDLLKMNIECSEREVFSKNLDSWLPKVRNMIVQLHDERASEDAFFSAMRDCGFLMARPPTLLACTEVAPKARAAPREIRPKRRDQNAISNGDFEKYRVEPGRIVPGNWLAGSTDIASHWRIVVCDPQFSVSLAVRTGRQFAGENALLIRARIGQPVAAGGAPYAAIENKTERQHKTVEPATQQNNPGIAANATTWSAGKITECTSMIALARPNATCGCAGRKPDVKAETFVDRRRELAARYDAALEPLMLQLPHRAADRTSAWHLYPIRVLANDPETLRRLLYDALLRQNVKSQVHYIPIHTQPFFQELGFRVGDFPESERHYSGELSLPLFVDLGDADQDRVIDVVREIVPARA